MSVLFNDARFNTSTSSRPRSNTGLWLSVGAHVTFAAVLMVVVPTRASENTSAPRPRSMSVFKMPVAELAPVKSIPVVAPRLPALPPVVPKPVQRAAIADVPKPVPVAPIVAKPVEPAPVALLPAAAPAFERPVEKAPERAPETGLFERTNSARPNQALPQVMTAGFGSAPSSPSTGQPSGAITTGGFGRTAASTHGAASGGEDVRTSGFDRRPSAPVQTTGAAAPVRVDRPVEIISKPTPEYTDEARSARIEGTVTLELEFSAAGEVRVVRVVRGLGHGLDEAAERAALKIRFKPAQSSDGRAVDSRATVYITFRLS